jgi:hypothetical protein
MLARIRVRQHEAQQATRQMAECARRFPPPWSADGPNVKLNCHIVFDGTTGARLREISATLVIHYPPEWLVG